MTTYKCEYSSLFSAVPVMEEKVLYKMNLVANVVLLRFFPFTLRHFKEADILEL
jgi:hypothetical protein